MEVSAPPSQIAFKEFSAVTLLTTEKSTTRVIFMYLALSVAKIALPIIRNSFYINNKLAFVSFDFGNLWIKCETILISVQVFRIQDNVTEVEVNPGPKAFWNNHVRKAFHRLSSCRENILNPKILVILFGNHLRSFLIRTWCRIKFENRIDFK